MHELVADRPRLGADTRTPPRFHADFAVLRVPLLAMETLAAWADGVRAPAACAGSDAQLTEALTADRAVLRARLLQLLADRQVSAAIELGSEDLQPGIRRWRLDPDGKAGRSAERSLTRYLARLSSRPSPFGLAAGYVLAELAGEPALRVGPRSALRIVSRIDPGLLSTVVRDAAARARGDAGLLVRVNPLAYRTGSRLRVPAPGTRPERPRLVALRATPAIEAAIATAAAEATVGAVLAAMSAAGAQANEAREQLDLLLDRAVLIPARLLALTGAEPTTAAVEALRATPGGSVAADTIERAARRLAAAPPGAKTATATKEQLAELRSPASPRRVVQVDAMRPGEIVLPRILINELARSIQLLARVSPERPDRLAEFRKRFERRFASRAVPLLEALDPDYGIRLAVHPQVHEPPKGERTARRSQLLALVGRAVASSADEIELTDADIAGLARAGEPRAPRSCQVMCRLEADDETRLMAGEFTIVQPSVVGPDGARLVGRFCHGDDALTDRVRRHLERAAQDQPEDIFAEVAVAPDTDWGVNITHRPVLREWEIECGGSSGADVARRIEPGDLLVSVVGDAVVLHSERLGRRVRPRLASALNPDWIAMPAARFLVILAQQEEDLLAWSWGELDDAPALPRIKRGRVVLSERRWNVSRGELNGIGAGTDGAGFRRLQAWRVGRGLPRFVFFEHPSNRLLVDFENVLSVDAFLAKGPETAVIGLTEAPGFDPADSSPGSPVRGPDGRYAHELVVAFTRATPTATAISRDGGRQAAVMRVSDRARRFEPGSEWLFAKLYGPRSAFDRVLCGPIAQLVAELRERRSIDRWFYIRYADPEAHLRIRFHGEPEVLLSDVLPALHRTAAPLLDGGEVYRVCLDTYEREIERYGGLEGTGLMEEIAQADSDAAVKLLAQRLSLLNRRRLAAVSAAALYSAFGLDLPACERLSRRLRDGLGRMLPGSAGPSLAADERADRSALATMLASLEADEPPAPLDALRARSDALAPLVQRLASLAGTGLLVIPVEDLVTSYAHMAANRILLESGGVEELRVHDALARIYAGWRARARLATTTNQQGDGVYA
jgi:thiopeptide-type bacteriocin biosynthesis protein